MPSHLLLTLAAILPFLGSAAAIALPNHARNAAALLAGSVTFASLVCIVLLHPALAGGPVVARLEWLPSLGVDLVLRLDGLAWLFAVLVLAIGSLIVLYARYYMAAADPCRRPVLLLPRLRRGDARHRPVGQPDPVVVFWELTSVVSFLLIGYWSETPPRGTGRGCR